MSKFSLFKSPITNLKPEKSIDLLLLYEIIKKDEQLLEVTQRYRELIDKKQQSEYKRSSFDYVTFSGEFTARNDNALVAYSGLICLDCDHLTEEELLGIKRFAVEDQHVALGFTSPSKGYKLIIKSSSLENHALIFNTFRNYIADKGILDIDKIDKSCINLSRACFLSHDAEAYLNPAIAAGNITEVPAIPVSSRIEDLREEDSPTTLTSSLNSLKGYNLDYTNKDLESNFRILINIMESKNGEYTSPREPWIQKLASYCNQFGMSRERTMDYMLRYFSAHPESCRADKPFNNENYIINPVNDVYERYSNQHNLWAKEKKIVSPILPEDVYELLPTFLKNACDIYPDSRDKDLVLLSCLTVISSYLPFYEAYYGKKLYSPNLNLFINAPASAGKGVIGSVRNLGNAFQRKIDEGYNADLMEYKQQVNRAKSPNSESEIAEIPLKPKRPIFYIPGNTSASKLLETMSVNKNFGLLFETEADTLIQALANDWGNFSDVIRKSSHHEPASQQRRTNDEYISIERTYLSILLSGTPSQLKNLMRGIEDGLFSRFLYYDLPLDIVWKDMFDESGPIPDIYFNAMSVELSNYIDKLQKFANSTEHKSIRFVLTSEQQVVFNNWFAKKQLQLYSIYENDLVANVRRHAVVANRIAMVLTIIRQMEGNVIEEKIVCKDEDFYSALSIIDCLLQHSIVIYNQIVKSTNSSSRSKKSNKQMFFEKLPLEFNKREAVEIGQALNIGEKSAEGYLPMLIDENLIKRVKHNHYVKV